MTANIVRWIEELQSSEESVRCVAARELCDGGEDARPAAVALVVATGDENEEVREWATAALEELGPPDVGDNARLAELLSRPELDIAYWAATLLGRSGNATAVPSLIAALTEHPESAVQQRAASALGKIGPRANAALAVLQTVAAASEANSRMRDLAADAIDRIS